MLGIPLIQEQPVSDILNHFRSMDFRKVAQLYFDDSKKRVNVDVIEDAYCSKSQGVYAKFRNGELLYVGKTDLKLIDRFKGYTGPVNYSGSDSTDQWAKHQIFLHGAVDIFAYVPPTQLKLFGHECSIAYGFEQALIKDKKPPWNIFKGKGKELKEYRIMLES